MTITKKIPHVRQIAMQREVMMLLICNRIGWSEAEFAEYQYQTGLDFIDDMIAGLNANDKKLITYSAMFWGWWANKWFERDECLYELITLNADDYCGIHDYELRTCEITIQSFYSHLAMMIDDGAESIKAEKEGAKI